MDLIMRISPLKLLIIIKLITDASVVGNGILGGQPSSSQSSPAPPPGPPPGPPPPNKLHKGVICGIDTANPDFTTIPDQCTALASYAKNTDVTPDYIAKLQQIKNIPYVYIVDSYSYNDFYERVEPDKINDLIAEITQVQSTTKAAALVFDYMNSYQIYGDIDITFNERIRDLFVGLKKQVPKLLIGLGLPKYQQVLSHAFNKELLDGVVDFYLADTVYYHDCKHKNHQKDMAKIAPPEDIKGTVDMMTDQGYKSDKIVIIIRVIVKTTRKGVAGDDEDMSYSDMCADNSVGKDRKFCVETLENFFIKGNLVYQKNLKGVLIQSVDRDDIKTTCKVGKTSFPVVKCITDGVFGQPEPTDLTTNANWALLPQDRPQ